MFLEQEGIATTVIGLIRLHLEKIQPPRALWVPFELGRPLGSPNQPAFQHAVLQAALELLLNESGPVVLADFPHDEPGAVADNNWPAPTLPAATMSEEVQQLQDLHQAAMQKFSRTTTGISGLDMATAAEYLRRFDSPEPMLNPHQDISDLALMRFATDDIKAYYLEAASSTGGQPSSQQLLEWFWYHTLAAKTIRAIRANCLASDEPKRNLVGNTLMPRMYL